MSNLSKSVKPDSVDTAMEMADQREGKRPSPLAKTESVTLAAPIAESQTQSPEVKGVASSVEVDAYAQGRKVAQGISVAQKQGFAAGLSDGIREEQAVNAEFFRECLNSAQDAFTFGE